jgi:hypothetical protein
MEPLEVANKKWNFLIASSKSWDGYIHRVELTPKNISYTVVHEGFRHKLNYFLFHWIFEKVLIRISKFLTVQFELQILKFKNLRHIQSRHTRLSLNIIKVFIIDVFTRDFLLCKVPSKYTKKFHLTIGKVLWHLQSYS